MWNARVPAYHVTRCRGEVKAERARWLHSVGSWLSGVEVGGRVSVQTFSYVFLKGIISVSEVTV